MRTTFPPLIPIDQACPSCLGSRQWVFFEQGAAPSGSCVLLADPREARDFPRGDLRLGFCSACGMISNTRFERARAEYGQTYEPSQHYSATFNAFARDLAQALVERHGVRGRTILEIGCGKGEFLELMCRLGGNRGVGIDPAADPARLSPQGRAAIELIPERYSERHHGVAADVFVCRHTLEHVDETLAFMASVRRHVGERAGALVVFELPDVARILSEGAFWDIYYEHCSYFSAGSLGRLFQRTGFEVLETSRVYDDQYLVVIARPAAPSGEAGGASGARVVDDLERMALAVASFEEVCRERLDAWRLKLWRGAAAHRRTVLWGAGSKAVAFLTGLEDAGRLEYVVDINPHKQEHYLPCTAQRVVAPEFLREYRPQEIVIMNPIYAGEVRAELERLGVAAAVTTVLGDAVPARVPAAAGQVRS